MIRGIGIFAGGIAFLCMLIGVFTLIEVLPLLKYELTWEVWFWLSGLLFLANIACVAGGRRGGGEGY